MGSAILKTEATSDLLGEEPRNTGQHSTTPSKIAAVLELPYRSPAALLLPTARRRRVESTGGTLARRARAGHLFGPVPHR